MLSWNKLTHTAYSDQPFLYSILLTEPLTQRDNPYSYSKLFDLALTLGILF